ncbi:MAG: hypothetical protein KDB10_24455, partial [Acidimicrobiales bacterium]|nr:hypothetical protein [Acidimicrobiales bacterium]
MAEVELDADQFDDASSGFDAVVSGRRLATCTPRRTDPSAPWGPEIEGGCQRSPVALKHAESADDEPRTERGRRAGA